MLVLPASFGWMRASNYLYHTKGRTVAKKPNYSFEKRQKDLAKKKKKEDKLKKKQERKAAGDTSADDQVEGDDDDSDDDEDDTEGSEASADPAEST